MTDTDTDDFPVDQFIATCQRVLNRPGSSDKSPVRRRDMAEIIVALGALITTLADDMGAAASTARDSSAAIKDLRASIKSLGEDLGMQT